MKSWVLSYLTLYYFTNMSQIEEEIIRNEIEGSLRHSGRTTKLADYFIQQLFTNGEVEVRDHWDQDSAHHYLTRIIVRRLEFEHLTTKFKVKGFNIKLIK